MKKKLIIYITELHNKPQGCGASVACAAGLFTNKKERVVLECQHKTLAYTLLIMQEDILQYLRTFNIVLFDTGTNFPAVSLNSLLASAMTKMRQR
jgi:hypothetical protein